MSAAAPVITVDGPGGTGKGTLCNRLGLWLRWSVLDSGALYRILALRAQQENIAVADAAGVAGLARDLDVRFVAGAGDDGIQVLLNGADVSARIRREDCGNAASHLAAHGQVRAAMLQRQRDFRRPPGLVADGRDMGTVVFPDADLKLFLTASPEERAKRRHKQLKSKKIDVSFARVMADISARDERDEQRALSPLKPAADAVIIDTSTRNAAQVFAQAVATAAGRFPGVAPYSSDEQQPMSCN